LLGRGVFVEPVRKLGDTEPVETALAGVQRRELMAADGQ